MPWHSVFVALAAVLLGCLGVGLGPSAAAQIEADWGRVPTRYFGPAEHGLDRHNWGIAQDADGFIYVANLGGVLVFDGVRWTPVDVETGVVRSIAYGFDDRVYVGAEGAPGYLTTADDGQLTFVSLASHLPPAYRDHTLLWETLATEHGVYFGAYEGWVFRWDGEQMTVYDPGSASSGVDRPGFDNLNAVGEVLYASLDDFTLTRLTRDGGHVPLYTFDGLFRSVLPDGPEHLLIATKHEGLWRCPRTSPQPAPVSAAEACERRLTDFEDLVTSGSLYTALRLSDGTIALGFDEQGVALFNADGRLLRFFDERSGLDNTEVMRLFEDRDGALWTALYAGVARIDVNAPATTFGRAEGLLSLANETLRHKDRLYAATMVGVYVLDASQQPARFERITRPGAQNNCWIMRETPDRLLALCNRDLLAIDGTRSRVLWTAPQRVYGFDIDPADPTRVYVGGYGGLYVVEPDAAGVYRSVATFDTGFPSSVFAERTEDDATTVWVGYADEAFYRVTFADRDPLEAAEVTHVPPADSTAGVGRAYWLDGAVRLAGRVSQRLRDDPTAPRFEPDPTVEAWAGDIAAPLHLADDNDGGRWFVGSDQALYVAHPQADRTEGYAPPMRVLPASPSSEINGLFFDEDGTGWLAVANGVTRLEPRARPRPRPQVFLRRVSTVETDSTLRGGGALAAPLVLPHQHGGVRFAFASPLFEHADQVAYRVRLDGVSDRWTEWSSETHQDYVNLREGAYTFRVQARDAFGRTSDEAAFSFRVVPPWYRTWWAYLLWSLSGLGMVVGVAWGYGRHRGRQLALRNTTLERAVTARTREIAAQKQEVEHRRRAQADANVELHRLNQSLEARTVELREALEQNKEFLGIAAHDLKNPMGGIAGMADFLAEAARELPDDELRDNLVLIRSEAMRAIALIESLLDEARADADVSGPRLKRRPGDLADIARAVLRWNRAQAEAKRIRLVASLPDALPAQVDASALQRAVDNYVSNAVKYSPPGSLVRLVLSVEAASGDGAAWARIAVEDEGPGLTEEDQAKAFGKLQRLSAQPTGGEHSTGLGLYIVKQLVEAHGGEVGVESEPGAGATFWLRLPLPPPDPFAELATTGTASIEPRSTAV